MLPVQKPDKILTESCTHFDGVLNVENMREAIRITGPLHQNGLGGYAFKPKRITMQADSTEIYFFATSRGMAFSTFPYILSQHCLDIEFQELTCPSFPFLTRFEQHTQHSLVPPAPAQLSWGRHGITETRKKNTQLLQGKTSLDILFSPRVALCRCEHNAFHT